MLGIISGTIAGLVAITPAAGSVDFTGAFFIGLLAGPVCFCAAQAKHRFGYDDALDAIDYSRRAAVSKPEDEGARPQRHAVLHLPSGAATVHDEDIVLEAKLSAVDAIFFGFWCVLHLPGKFSSYVISSNFRFSFRCSCMLYFLCLEDFLIISFSLFIL